MGDADVFADVAKQLGRIADVLTVRDDDLFLTQIRTKQRANEYDYMRDLVEDVVGVLSHVNRYAARMPDELATEVQDMLGRTRGAIKRRYVEDRELQTGE